MESVIASFRSPDEAQFARNAMAQAGIESTLVRDGLGVGIAVRSEDADRATEILEGIWPEPVVEAPVIEIERCGECGSSDLIRIRRLPFFIIFTTLMLVAGYATGEQDLFLLVVGITAALLFFGPNRRCANCGERWRNWGGDHSPPPPEQATEPPAVACPRCGSGDTVTIDRRRMKAWTMLINFVLPPLLLLWPFMPRRKCEECGHEFR